MVCSTPDGTEVSCFFGASVYGCTTHTQFACLDVVQQSEYYDFSLKSLYCYAIMYPKALFKLTSNKALFYDVVVQVGNKAGLQCLPQA